MGGSEKYSKFQAYQPHKQKEKQRSFVITPKQTAGILTGKNRQNMEGCFSHG
jgi:hypothetical protein